MSSGSLFVSDQPVMEEDSFLPMTSVSRGGEAAVIRLAELHSPDTMQGRAASLFDDDEEEQEEQQPDRDQSVTTEPDLEDLGLEDLVEEENETFSSEVEDYGSGSWEENESSEEEEEEEVLAQMVPAESDIWTDLQPRVSEEKEKTKNESDLNPRYDSQFEDVEEDGKKTWYFWK